MPYLGPIERDVFISLGLLLAVVLHTYYSYGRFTCPTAIGRKTVGLLSVVGIASIGAAMYGPITRIVKYRETSLAVESIRQYVVELSDQELKDFGIKLDANTWKRMPPDACVRLIARAKSEGRLYENGCDLGGDGHVCDLWRQPFRIAVSMQDGKRVVIVDSVGCDGMPGTADDIQRRGTPETQKE